MVGQRGDGTAFPPDVGLVDEMLARTTMPGAASVSAALPGAVLASPALPVATAPALARQRAVDRRGWSPAVSPDGRWVALVSDRGGTPQVWLQDTFGGPARLIETGEPPVVEVSWSPDGQWLACVVAPGGAPRREIWLVRPDGSERRQVAGFGATHAVPGRWLPTTGELALTEIEPSGTATTPRDGGAEAGHATRGGAEAGHATRGGVVSRALLVDPGTGERRTVATGSLLAIQDVSDDGHWALLRTGPRRARRLVAVRLVDPEVPGGTETVRLLPGAGSSEQGCFSADGSAVLARTDVGAELGVLVRVPLAAPGDPQVLAGRLDAEVERFAITAHRDAVAVVWNVDGGTSEVSLQDLGADGTADGSPRPVAAVHGSVVGGLTFGSDGTPLVMAVEGPALPSSLWCHDPVSGTGRWLAGDRCATGTIPARPSPTVPSLHRFQARDGLRLSGWLYRPVGAGPHPTLLSLHGDPESQSRPGYNELFQTLVAAGVAVFAPNVRGSSGFGKSFANAERGAGRFAAVTDVADCVEYLVGAGIADPGRIGCAGRSYGGYLALAALVSYPQLFTVGIDVCGVSDLTTFYERTEPWIAAAAVSEYGHPDRDRHLLRERSPLPRIARIAAPLLVVHGANDTNVPVHESRQLVTALRRFDKTHRYLEFPGEGHELLNQHSRLAFDEAVLAWLREHLRERVTSASAPTRPAVAGPAVIPAG